MFKNFIISILFRGTHKGYCSELACADSVFHKTVTKLSDIKNRANKKINKLNEDISKKESEKDKLSHLINVTDNQMTTINKFLGRA
ncbi:MAG: hypothetical protein ACRDD8_06235 [Bacteroidales bacterium]